MVESPKNKSDHSPTQKRNLASISCFPSENICKSSQMFHIFIPYLPMKKNQPPFLVSLPGSFRRACRGAKVSSKGRPSSAISAAPRSSATRPAGAASITATSTSVRSATGRKRPSEAGTKIRNPWMWQRVCPFCRDTAYYKDL